jgi:hypothetical protein
MASRGGDGVLLEHVGGVMGVVWVERRGRCSLREVDGQGRGLRFRSELFSRTEKVHVLASGTLGTCSFDLDLLEYCISGPGGFGNFWFREEGTEL